MTDQDVSQCGEIVGAEMLRRFQNVNTEKEEIQNSVTKSLRSITLRTHGSRSTHWCSMDQSHLMYLVAHHVVRSPGRALVCLRSLIGKARDAKHLNWLLTTAFQPKTMIRRPAELLMLYERGRPDHLRGYGSVLWVEVRNEVNFR